MKKYFAVFLIFVFVLSLAGCNSHQPNTQDTPSTSSVTESILDHLIEEDGEQYLILPISKKRVRVTSSHMQYLDEIDLNLLRTAEEKIRENIAQYTDNEGYFYLGDGNGYLSLCTEVIIDITPPSGTNDGGCGIDHEHKFFKERISK